MPPRSASRLHAAKPHQPIERAPGRTSASPRWLAKWRFEQSQLLGDELLAERDEDVRAPRSPSYFGISYSRIEWSRNVFHVSSQASRWSWWRSCRACVRTRSGSTRLQLLEDVLDLAADVREEAVAEAVHDDVGSPRRRGTPRRSRGLVSRARPARRARPSHLELRARAREREQRAAATDLDVVRVAADARARVGAARRASRARARASESTVARLDRAPPGRAAPLSASARAAACP